MSDITITAEAPLPITLTLVGVEYTVRPIKGSLGISLSQKFQGDNSDMVKFDKSIKDLLRIMFGPEQAKEVQKRLNDSEDLLDLPHVFELLNALVEKASGNPTT